MFVCCRTALLAAAAFPFAIEKIASLERRMQSVVQWINDASQLLAQSPRGDFELAVTLCTRAKAEKVILLSYSRITMLLIGLMYLKNNVMCV